MIIAALCLCDWAAGAYAATMVGISGTLGDKALISVNGAPARVLATGQQLDGVRVIEVRGDRVTIEVEGQRRTLKVGLGDAFATRRTLPDKTEKTSGREGVVLTADARGHFSTQVEINGVSAPFLVDTGASVVTLPSSLARRANIDLERATPITISTANGRAKAYRVVLNTVKVGSLGAHLVEAVVIDDAKLPFALLGMSFLNRMNMHREGDSLTLLQRY
ncbi:MAG: TIGR02281 family clan AA aspartic protease [Pseudomonadota bacterium]|nr:TIGR02281 family clan AA aspartic protease [Pseudomonadota bacterium]